MKCPHCNTSIADAFTGNANIWTAPEVFSREGKFLAHGAQWSANAQRCPECHEQIIFLKRTYLHRVENPGSHNARVIAPGVPPLEFMAYPNGSARPIPTEVVEPYRQDFYEACLVLVDSPKASAALSRRCVQAILRDKAGTKKRDLYDQIEEVIQSGKYPSFITEGLHAVRQIGNFAAHPNKSTATGEIIDVEPNEAEWNLEILERLFDYFFVKPALHAKRMEELKQKAAQAAKPTTP